MLARLPDNLLLPPLVVWYATGLGVLGTALAFGTVSHFPEIVPVFEILPITWVVIIGLLSGLMFLVLPGAINQLISSRKTLLSMVAVGLAARLILFSSEPLWEIDYFRYLWDGGMLANGKNPYVWSPENILSGHVPGSVLFLAFEADGLVDSINYPHLRTIYPPLAEIIFAATHILDAWSITSWRAVLLAFDLTSLGLLVVLLRHLDRSPLWAALYWWNPLIIQMFFNAVHMDALLIPFMLAALLFAIRLKPVLMSGLLALAVGIKLWPVLLFPALLRHGGLSHRAWIWPVGIFGVVSLIVISPLIVTGLGQGSGLTAFAETWNKNSALFGATDSLLATLFVQLSLYEIDSSKIVRVVVAGLLISISLGQARHRSTDAEILCQRIVVVTTALFMLSPAAYPWYASWVFAFLVLSPNAALLMWTATLPLYHLRFHPFFQENPTYFENGIVWLEHGPVMAMLVWQWISSRRRSGE